MDIGKTTKHKDYVATLGGGVNYTTSTKIKFITKLYIIYRSSTRDSRLSAEGSRASNLDRTST